ncbi:MAG: hypothetical protein EHM51_01120 [Geobacter sp.]|nr:MAG: hypothetical protein EHM51_01120 [Geobacter sp.]
MKQHLTWNLVAILALSASAACAGNVGVDVNIHLGDQPQQVIVREPIPPPPPPRVIRIEEDVNFIYPEALGFYVAVGVPYDLFYVRNNYYVFRDGRWLRASRSHGPWTVMKRRDLPPGLRRHQIERIRTYRDSEYDSYRRDREHYRGRHFVSGKEEWKERRKEEKEYRKDVKRAEKEERKADKEDRKHHRGRDHDDH